MNNTAPADIVIYIKDKGEVLREKSLIAVSEGKIAAWGNECVNMQSASLAEGKDLIVISPFKQGQIDDFTLTVQLLKVFLQKTQGRKKPFSKRPVIGLCAPYNMTVVNRKAFEDAIYLIGAGKCIIFDAPLEQVLNDWQSEDNRKIDMIIAIENDNPLEYLQEMIEDVLIFAAKNNISTETVREMLDKQG